MPDWSYRTLFRPLLFRLPAYWARELTLQAMGGLSRLPGGRFVIRTFADREVHPEMESGIPGMDVPLPSPVGLSGGLDPRGSALTALSQLDFGFVEIGPIGMEEAGNVCAVERCEEKEEIVYPEGCPRMGVDELVHRLNAGLAERMDRPLFFRVKPEQGLPPDEAVKQLRGLFVKLTPYATGFFVDFGDDRAGDIDKRVYTDVDDGDDGGTDPAIRLVSPVLRYLEAIRHEARLAGPSLSLLLRIPADYDDGRLEELLAADALKAWDGVVIGDSVRTEYGEIVGSCAKRRNLEKIRLIREHSGQQLPIFAAGGIHEPADALELLDAGAGLFMLHSGLVYAGPGLAKRVNEAILDRRANASTSRKATPFWQNWGWMGLLGLGMIIGGLLAFLVAATDVVLPYDERFLGMNRSDLFLANPFLLKFMSHDRVTLAGTMISIGILYWQLSYYGLRRGRRWARTALTTSCIVGFAGFFLYLGYGYFDPLHAVAAVVLFPMFLLSLRGKANQPPNAAPNLRSDRSWLLAQWGQLMFIMLGVALAAGGVTIAWIGVHEVFVPTDIAYLCASPEVLAKLNDKEKLLGVTIVYNPNIKKFSTRRTPNAAK